MKKPRAGIIDISTNNILSIKRALEFIGFETIVINEDQNIEKFDLIVLPGVGAFNEAMKTLHDKDLIKTIDKSLNKNKNFLGICLGMQLLCEATEEGAVKGLGVIPGRVIRFSNKVKVPQVGWNNISKLQTSLFQCVKEDDFMYLVHSYYVPLIPETIAQSYYDGPYTVALRKDNFYGVQFHPEKSSSAGSQILKNFFAL